MSSSRSFVIPDDIIFEILQWIHPCIYLIISKNLFRPWSKPDKEKLTISLTPFLDLDQNKVFYR